MKWYYIVLIVVVLLLAILGIVLSIYVGYPKKHSNGEFERDNELYNKFKDKLESFKVKSHDGYILHACLLKANKESNKFVIISHGYTAFKECSLKYASIYNKLDFNAIIYDDRYHGENKRGKSVTLGKNESKDLIAMINDTYNKYGKDIYLGLHGESMGSGLQIMALKYKPDVKFIVNDCGYAKLRNVLNYDIKVVFHLPTFLVAIASIMSSITCGFFYKQVRPIKYLKDNQIPICFVTSDHDHFVPPSDTLMMAEITKGYHETHVFENAEHACSYWQDPIRYEKMVTDFLNNIK